MTNIITMSKKDIARLRASVASQSDSPEQRLLLRKLRYCHDKVNLTNGQRKFLLSCSPSHLRSSFSPDDYQRESKNFDIEIFII